MQTTYKSIMHILFQNFLWSGLYMNILIFKMYFVKLILV